jgi:transcription elongation factor GreA
MDKKVYLTKEGYANLKDELDQLLNSERKAVAEKIKTAKEYGDLSENAEYSDAKEQQSFVEGRILEIEHMMKNAEVIDEAHLSCDTVNVGCTVHLEASEKELIYRIVGSAEADPKKGLISNESPIGKALIGKRKGEEVSVAVPAGTTKYKINKIK